MLICDINLSILKLVIGGVIVLGRSAFGKQCTLGTKCMYTCHLRSPPSAHICAYILENQSVLRVVHKKNIEV